MIVSISEGGRSFWACENLTKFDAQQNLSRMLTKLSVKLKASIPSNSIKHYRNRSALLTLGAEQLRSIKYDTRKESTVESLSG